MSQRPTTLNPDASRMEAWKITYPKNRAPRKVFKLEPMRFVPHTGMAEHIGNLDGDD